MTIKQDQYQVLDAKLDSVANVSPYIYHKYLQQLAYFKIAFMATADFDENHPVKKNLHDQIQTFAPDYLQDLKKMQEFIAKLLDSSKKVVAPDVANALLLEYETFQHAFRGLDCEEDINTAVEMVRRQLNEKSTSISEQASSDDSLGEWTSNESSDSSGTDSPLPNLSLSRQSSPVSQAAIELRNFNKPQQAANISILSDGEKIKAIMDGFRLRRCQQDLFFWESKTAKGRSGYGGKHILSKSGNSFRIPHRIKAMMLAAETNQDKSFDVFIQAVKRAQNSSPLKFRNLFGWGRHTDTQKVYNSDLESDAVAEKFFEPRVTFK